MGKESKSFQFFWILIWMSYLEMVWITIAYGIMLELFACSTCFNLLLCNVCFEELDISCHLPFFMAIYQLRKIICLFCLSHWDLPNHGVIHCALGMLQSPQWWVGLHWGGGFIMFRPKVQKLMNNFVQKNQINFLKKH